MAASTEFRLEYLESTDGDHIRRTIDDWLGQCNDAKGSNSQTFSKAESGHGSEDFSATACSAADPFISLDLPLEDLPPLMRSAADLSIFSRAPPQDSHVEVQPFLVGSPAKVAIVMPIKRIEKRKMLSCSYCTDNRYGFHGEHELRRHLERSHTEIRKVWVCKDVSEDGRFLADCKACRNGKTYGANYNAAAHLRRTHFRPTQNMRGAKSRDKRGGLGGRNWPPMEELKLWMEERFEDERYEPPGSSETKLTTADYGQESVSDCNGTNNSWSTDNALAPGTEAAGPYVI